jgi:phosphoribosyl-ATP pyrophosphohydrolase/phosphoribosyl-AMP cyclohydrolase/histidinol dehydrogenase
MRHADLTTVSAAQRSALLRRPVLDSKQMIEKVRPIVDEVRKRGDAAVLELTAKFDKARLKEPVIHVSILRSVDGRVSRWKRTNRPSSEGRH